MILQLLVELQLYSRLYQRTIRYNYQLNSNNFATISLTSTLIVVILDNYQIKSQITIRLSLILIKILNYLHLYSNYSISQLEKLTSISVKPCTPQSPFHLASQHHEKNMKGSQFLKKNSLQSRTSCIYNLLQISMCKYMSFHVF